VTGRKLAELAGLAAGLALLFPLQAAIDAARPQRPSSFLYTPDRRLMKVISFGHELTLADLVWVQSTDYVITEFTSGKTHIEHLYNLYDVITDLDPNYIDAYVMGSTFLSSVAEQPERALELLEKGEGKLLDDGVTVTDDPAHPGKVHPDHKDRWKLLNETAGTHLVSLAGFAPTLAERQAEVRLGGRLYLFAAKRYPYSVWKRDPAFPDWFEDMGTKLTQRQEDLNLRTSWYQAVETVWLQRKHFSVQGSPIDQLCDRRLAEIRSLYWKDVLDRAMAKYAEKEGAAPGSLKDLVPFLPKPLTELPKDPVGVGYFLVGRAVVAPALDAARLERELTRRLTELHARNGRWPASIAELEAAFAGTGLALSPIPRWVTLTYDPETGEVRASAAPGALVR
jgi:hypothetical protein